MTTKTNDLPSELITLLSRDVMLQSLISSKKTPFDANYLMELEALTFQNKEELRENLTKTLKKHSDLVSYNRQKIKTQNPKTVKKEDNNNNQTPFFL